MLLAVPNLSTGPDQDVLLELERAFSISSKLLDCHSDRLHGRTVLTLAGRAGGLRDSLVAGARVAIEELDLGAHAGAHPRIGVLDVAPIVFPDERAAAPASALARELGARLGDLGLPVFLYGDLAASEERRERHHFRRGGIEALRERMAAGELVPDFGPATPHASAGAVLTTARRPLAAFNVEVDRLTLGQGRELAAALREAGGGLPGVRALAIQLDDGRVQISTNVHDPVALPLAEVVAEVDRLAEPLGGRTEAAELIGLVPAAALAGYPYDDVPIRGFEPAERTIEARLRSLAGRGAGAEG
jgi:glutamate formiminotransferase